MSKIIEVNFPGGKKVGASVNGHVILTDQPASNGGENTAPSPFDLFLASIATCGGFYAAEFCHKRDIGLEGLSLRLVCEPDPETRLYGKMIFELCLPAGFPEDQVDALKRSINACTVKKHMMDTPAFDIRVKETVPA